MSLLNSKINKGFIKEYLTENAKNNLDKKALIIEGVGYLTYREYLHFFNKIVHFFKKINLKKNDRIGVISPNPFVYAIASLPIVDNGVYVSLDYTLSDKILIDAFHKYKLNYILVDHSDYSFIESAKELGIGIIILNLPLDKHYTEINLYLMNEQTIKNEFSFKSELTAYIANTSGTTSVEKLIIFDYSKFIKSQFILIDYYQITNKTHLLNTVNINRVNVIRYWLRLLLVNATLYLVNGYDLNIIQQIFAKYPIDYFHLPPVALESSLDFFTKNQTFQNSNNLKIFNAGSPLNKDVKILLEELFNIKIYNIYGMTEVNLISSDFESPNGYKQGSVGKPSYQEVKIENGEVYIKGEYNFEGYEYAKAFNSDVFENGWFHTGDLGYLDQDGYLYITGRKNELINVGGEKVLPYELESLLREHPQIDNAVIFPFKYHEDQMTYVGVAIVTKNQKILSIKDIRKHLFGRVNNMKLPRALWILNEFPVSKNNKIQRITFQLAINKDQVLFYDEIPN